MQERTEEAEASVSTDNAREGPEENLNRTVAVRRKAAKRSLPWDLAAGELDLVSLPPPQAEVIPARKKQRLEEPFSASTASTDEAATRTALPDVSVGLLPPAADDDDVNVDLVTDTQPNAGANRATGLWTIDEDAKLTSAVANTSKKKLGNEYKIDWNAVAVLVPGRARNQCYKRWQRTLDPSIDRTPSGRTGTWTEDEDIKLKDAVQTHGGKNWDAVAALVPGRTRAQCHSKWQKALDSSIDRTPGLTATDRWTKDEDTKLKDAVKKHGGKNWKEIAVLVPGRTRVQCYHRWRDSLDPSIALTAGRTGKWRPDEDDKLKDSVQLHGGNWAAISTLVPDRTRMQCYNRWQNTLNPSIDRMTGLVARDRWTKYEDIKLKDAVRRHGGKNWKEIAVLVPDRSSSQCCRRWHNTLNPSIALTAGRTGKWTPADDDKLKDAVQMHGGKDWDDIAVLVPGRTKRLCWSIWCDTLNPSIALAARRTGKWTPVEDIKLKDAVERHSGKNWDEITALVPGRTQKQCRNRWHYALMKPSIDRTTGLTGKWAEDEDCELKGAVQTYGGKNWDAIAALVPGRTRTQCQSRWQNPGKRTWHSREGA
jgi:hypothetical protein